MGNQRTTLSLALATDEDVSGELKAALSVVRPNGQLAQRCDCRIARANPACGGTRFPARPCSERRCIWTRATFSLDGEPWPRYLDALTGELLFSRMDRATCGKAGPKRPLKIPRSSSGRGNERGWSAWEENQQLRANRVLGTMPGPWHAPPQPSSPPPCGWILFSSFEVSANKGTEGLSKCSQSHS